MLLFFVLILQITNSWQKKTMTEKLNNVLYKIKASHINSFLQINEKKTYQ